MSFSNPSMEMNLYRAEILHDIDLIKDGDLPILSNHIDSPFMNPEIFPSTRVGRWKTQPHLENYVELDYGEQYKIKLFNYTWGRCMVNVTIDNKPIGEWKINARSQITIRRPQMNPSFKCGPQEDNRINHDDHFRFFKYGTQSDLIVIRFRPEKWTDNMIDNLMNGECKEVPIWSLDSTKETIMYVRLVCKRRYSPYQTVIAFREDCPSYVS
jgi:hypothetical protein